MATKTSAAEKKRVKEATRKNCMVKNILDSFAMLPLSNGISRLDKIEQLTQTKVIKAALSEIPCIIREFYTDGTSPSKRPPGFYQGLRLLLEEILKCCEEEELEQQQAVNNLGNNQPSSALPEIAVHIRLPASDDDMIDISWISDTIETVLDCTRLDVIGQPLSKLIRPEDYIFLHKNLMELKKAMNPETSQNLEPFVCHVAPLWRVRAGKNPNDRKVTLQGVVRLWPNPNGTLPAELSEVERPSPPAKRRALAAYASSCPSPSSLPITWPRQSTTFVDLEITSYVTLHSVVDMSILWVDERITHVNLWKPEDVVGRNPYLYIDPQHHSHNLAVHNLTLAMGRYAMVSYAFKRKCGDTIYQRSRSCGKIFTFYPTNNQPIQCYKLFTERISEEECLEDRMRAENELLSGLSPPFIIEDTNSNLGASIAEEYAENRKKAELLYSEYSPSIDAASFKPEASRAIEYSNMAEPGDIVGYQGCSYSPEYYFDVHPASDSTSEISAMRRQSAVDCSEILEGIVNRCL